MPEGLLDAAAERKVLGLLGLGIRGRLAVVGVDRVREAAHRGTLRYAAVAADASSNSREKIDGLLAAKGVRVVLIGTADALGEAAGKATTAVIGVVDAKLAAGIHAIVDPSSAVRKDSRRKG